MTRPNTMVDGVTREMTPEEYADWQAVPANVPQDVSARQLELALSAAGYLTTVQGLVAAADDATQITWARMTIALRNDAMLTGMASAAPPYGLGLTSDQVDALFVAAAGYL